MPVAGRDTGGCSSSRTAIGRGGSSGGHLHQLLRSSDGVARTEGITSRAFVTRGAAAATGVAALAVAQTGGAAAAAAVEPSTGIEERSIAELSALMASGDLTARGLVRACLRRISALDTRGPQMRAFIETNPDALRIAARLDEERHRGQVRGPLHGIPIVIKDNIDTDDEMQTTAGLLALAGSAPLQDATLAAKLSEAGAIILGRANLSKWGQLPGIPVLERVERTGISGRQSVHHRSQPMWLVVGLRYRRVRQSRRGGVGYRNRRIDRMPVECYWAGGDQADGRPHEPRRGGANITYPGHRWADVP